MPDGANTDNTDDTAGAEQNPGTPAEQLDQEVAATRFSDVWRSIFPFGGDPQPHESGGGGAGGQFMFASLEELDGVVAKWEQEQAGIRADQQTILDALDAIDRPAGDPMSTEQAAVSRQSLARLLRHNEFMLNYAENYVAKLKASRVQMAATEDGNRDNLRSIEA